MNPNTNVTVLCAFIGVAGTLAGTVIGYLLPYLGSLFGKKALNITDVRTCFGTGEATKSGDYLGSSLYFELSAINKKNKTLILENLYCELYSGTKLLNTFKCQDDETGRFIAGCTYYKDLPYIDISAKSSVLKKVNIPVKGNLSSCDKVVFNYSWGILNRKKTIWVKEDTIHANT